MIVVTKQCFKEFSSVIMNLYLLGGMRYLIVQRYVNCCSGMSNAELWDGRKKTREDRNNSFGEHEDDGYLYYDFSGSGVQINCLGSQ